MASNGTNGINLKVFLEPDITNLQGATTELEKAVKASGDKGITKQFDVIKQKVQSIQEIFEKGSFGRETFKATGKEIQQAFSDIQKLALNISKTDLSENVKKYQSELTASEKKIKTIYKNIAAEKKALSASSKNEAISGANLTRRVKVKGQTQGTPIKSFEAAVNYQKQLEAAGKTNTATYRQLTEVINQINAAEEKHKQALNDQNAALVKEKKHYDDIADKMKAAQNAGSSKASPAQTAATGAYNKAASGKMQSIGNVSSGIQAVDDAKDKKDNAAANAELAKSGDKVTGSFGKAVQNLTSYTLILGTMKRALRSALETIKVLDTALTEQAMVAGKTKEEMTGLLTSYQNIAQTTGATTKEVASVSTEYFRQGKSASEALVLTEAAVSAAKVGAISTKDSVDYLTTAINGFGLAANDAMQVSDKFAALAASSATNYEELAVALSKVASQANLAGMSMDYTLGLLAKGIETTREAPETIGTALKTIVARMREMTDYGKTLEGDTDVNNLETQLGYVGIALRDTNGELRSTQAVLDEVGRSWDTFSANQQAALAKAMAGTRQQSRFISIMQDYDRTLELVSISQNSVGATSAQMSTYMTSIQAATNQVSVAWEKLVTSLSNTDAIIDGLNFIAEVIGNIATFASTDFGLTTILTTVITMLAMGLGIRINEKATMKAQAIEQEKITKSKSIEYLTNQKDEKLKKVQAKLDMAAAKVEDKKADLLETQLHLEHAKTTQKNLQARIDRGEKVSQKEILKAKSGMTRAINKNNAAQQALNQAVIEEKQAIKDAEIESAQINAEYKVQVDEINAAYERGSGILAGITGLFIGIVSIAKVFTFIMGGIVALAKAYNVLKKAETKEQRKQILLEKKKQLVKKINAMLGIAENAGTNIPIAGIAIAAAVLAMIGLGVAIAAVSGGFASADEKRRKRVQARTQQVQELSAQLVKLNKSIQAIDEAEGVFNRFDDGVIHTKEEVAQLEKAVDKAVETLSEGDKARVLAHKTLKGQMQELKNIREEKQAEFDATRKMQLALINSGDTDKMLEDAKNQAVVYDIVTSAINRQIAALKELIAQKLKEGELTEEEAKEQTKTAEKTNEIANEIIGGLDAKELNSLIQGQNASVLNKWAKKNDSTHWSNRWDEDVWDDIVIGSGYHNSGNKKKVWNAIRGGNWDEVEKIVGKTLKDKIFKAMGYDQITLADDKIAELVVGGVNDATITTMRDGEEVEIAAADILKDSNSSAEDIVKAYDAIQASINNKTTSSTGETFTAEEKDMAIKGLSKEYGLIRSNAREITGWGSTAGNYIKEKNLSMRDLSDFHNRLNKIKTSNGEKLSGAKLGEVITAIATRKPDEDMISVIGNALGYTWDKSSLETDSKAKQALSAFTKLMTTAGGGTLERAMQGTKKLQNDIADFYKKQKDYKDKKMTEDEFAVFAEAHKSFFANEEAYNAFINGEDLSQYLGVEFDKRAEEQLKYLQQQKENADMEGNTALSSILQSSINKLTNKRKLYGNNIATDERIQTLKDSVAELHEAQWKYINNELTPTEYRQLKEKYKDAFAVEGMEHAFETGLSLDSALAEAFADEKKTIIDDLTEKRDDENTDQATKDALNEEIAQFDDIFKEDEEATQEHIAAVGTKATEIEDNIKSIYEAQAAYLKGELSDTDLQDLITNNKELFNFKDKDGKSFLDYFKSGDSLFKMLQDGYADKISNIRNYLTTQITRAEELGDTGMAEFLTDQLHKLDAKSNPQLYMSDVSLLTEKVNAFQNEIVEIYSKQAEVLSGSLQGAELNEFIAAHPDFFKNKDIIEAFKRGDNIVDLIQSTMGEKQQKLQEEVQAQKELYATDSAEYGLLDSTDSSLEKALIPDFKIIDDRVKAFKQKIKDIHEKQEAYLTHNLSDEELEEFIRQNRDFFKDEATINAFKRGDNLSGLLSANLGAQRDSLVNLLDKSNELDYDANTKQDITSDKDMLTDSELYQADSKILTDRAKRIRESIAEAYQKQYAWLNHQMSQDELDEYMSQNPNLFNTEVMREAFKNGESLQQYFQEIFKEQKEQAIQALEDKLAALDVSDVLGREKLQNQIDALNSDSAWFSPSAADITQQSKDFQNKIAEVYKAQSDFLNKKMDNTQLMEFVQKHPEIFNTEINGKTGLEAFKAGESIAQYLQAGLEKERTRLADYLQTKLEEAKKVGNAADQKIYEDELNALQNVDALYAESLDSRLAKQKVFLEEYKKLKQKERDEEIKNLEARKQAYDAYFAKIDAAEEEADYEEKRNTLLNKISQLGAGTDSTSQNSRVELTKQLEDLEKERLKTLKDQARQQMVKDIDDNIAQIKDDFDALLENTNEILEKLRSPQQQREFASDILQNIFKDENSTAGQKSLDFVNLLTKLQPAMAPESWENMIELKEKEGNIILNIAGDEYNLGSKKDNMDIWNSIQAALKQLGLQ